MRDETLGLYFHLPFCDRICPYCDFAVVAMRGLESGIQERYVRALQAELAVRAAAPALTGRRLASLYFGGGTPSLMSAAAIGQLVESAARHFSVDSETEITLEVNPSTLERERLPEFRSVGVGRLSLGIQSFDDVVLKRLGRAHRAEEGRATLAAARAAGFENLSIDLIFAAPGQSAESVEADVAAVVEFGPEHVSTYELVIEPQTPFEIAAQRGQLEVPPEPEVLRMMESIEARLADAGFERYELASYARNGFEAVHNSRYWTREPVLGLGVGAHSCDPRDAAQPHGARRANTRGLAEYLTAVESGETPEVDYEALDASTARGEAVFLALRRTAGLRADAFSREFGKSPRAFFANEIDALLGSGLLTESGEGDLQLTARGRLLADGVSQHFV